MRLRKEISFTKFGWTVGVDFSPGWLLLEVAWELSPLGLFLAVPFLLFWIERAEQSQRARPWQWSWSVLRLTVWKTEFRLDVDLHIWGLGISCVERADSAVHVGPFNVQIETDKTYDVDFPPWVPTLRLFFPSNRSIQPWPPRCECDTSKDRSKGDVDTDVA
jgi:hypothetical protein